MTKTLNVIKKTGINQYYMDDNKVYIVNARGTMKQTLTLRENGNRMSYEVIEFECDENFNLVSVTILLQE